MFTKVQKSMFVLLVTLWKCECFIKPVARYSQIIPSKEFMEPVEFIESWDDGEIPWDFKDGKTGENVLALAKRHYLLLEPKKYNFWNEKMDDGEVEWEMNIQVSVKTNSKTFMRENEMKTDKMIIWDFIDDVKRNENVNMCIHKMAEQLVTTENIFSDVLNIDNSRAEFDVLMTAAVMLMNLKNQGLDEEKNNGKKGKTNNPLNLLFMVVGFLLTKGVEPTF